MDNNGRQHWAHSIDRLMESEKFARIDGLMRFPVSNPIGRPYLLLYTQLLKEMPIQKWISLSLDLLNKLATSMRNCRLGTNRVKEGYILTKGHLDILFIVRQFLTKPSFSQ
ncbi:hypothetical protein AVEN_229606-1 [Araneus ventricosus]|uniref:Uncharacterized protein n=1 Tax=Araneus ventricosus TaxID=182803 RepID=A0A4Y2DCQ6_ARAVE|nr:hypothetical protein AVEN_229606-1 [Araneus ventricosus]